MVKNKKGITLIALIITVTLLLIIASVSISSLTGSEGILKQADKEHNKVENGISTIY